MRKFDTAVREMKAANPDIQKFVRLTEEASEAGDDRAEYALATWYLHGAHVAKNKRKAISLLRRAADKGNANAMFDLAVAYEKGDGLKKSQRHAFNYFLSASQNGDKQAHFEVGRMLYYGVGTIKNKKLANIWLDKAEKYGISMDNQYGVTSEK